MLKNKEEQKSNLRTLERKCKMEIYNPRKDRNGEI
jgi:hypothetical protein